MLVLTRSSATAHGRDNPFAGALMRLKFQSFLQTSECWNDHTAWHDRAPPTITQHRMQLVGPPFTSLNGVAFFERLNVKRHSFRLKNTGVGPMTLRALCCDYTSGEIYESIRIDHTLLDPRVCPTCFPFPIVRSLMCLSAFPWN
jgi:hypothetical protein